MGTCVSKRQISAVITGKFCVFVAMVRPLITRFELALMHNRKSTLWPPKYSGHGRTLIRALWVTEHGHAVVTSKPHYPGETAVGHAYLRSGVPRRRDWRGMIHARALSSAHSGVDVDRHIRTRLVHRGCNPRWQGDLFAGSWRCQVRRLRVENNRVTLHETLHFDARIRDIINGPDGHLYVATDEVNGRILKIVPAGP